MPQATPGVDLDQYQKEKDQFSDAVDDVFSEENEGKTDEEIIKAMDEKDADGQNVDGISKKDSDEEAAKKAKAKEASDLLDDGQKPKDVIDDDTGVPVTKEIEDPPATEAEWKTKAELLEAELAKEKQKTSSWNGRITAANTKVKGLEEELEKAKQGTTAAAAKADANTESDNEVLDRFRKDFPELSDVVDIMQKRIDGVVAPAKVDTDSTNTPDSTDDDAEAEAKKKRETHVSDIRKEHPDLSEMVNTGVLLTWINQQPDFIRPTLETIYNKGKSDEVIKMVTEFKDKTGWISQLAKDGKTKDGKKDSKLNSMLEVNSETTTPDGKTVDKNDFDQGAKDAGL